MVNIQYLIHQKLLQHIKVFDKLCFNVKSKDQKEKINGK